jgi:membrane-bound lytic murein transglycosylase D
LTLGIAGFLLIQVAKATAIEHVLNQYGINSNDTTLKEDSVNNQNDQQSDIKDSFKTLLSTAMDGEGATSAKLNPMAITFVKNYIARNKQDLLKMKEWGKGYLNMMDDILSEHGIPSEMKYLAVIESGLKRNAVSWAGAAGPWAFMPEAAREYGLRITKGRDDRMDYYKSTHAAARYLTDLYSIYGDWLLVVAAYNCGPGNVNKAIRRGGGSKDFWTIQRFLPKETMNHVKKFIGTHYLFEGGGGVTTLTKKETKEQLLNTTEKPASDELENTTAYKITGRFNAAVIIKHIDLDMATFNRFNPGFENEIALNGKYELRLPTQKMNLFVAKRYEILEESMEMLLKSTNTNSR